MARAAACLALVLHVTSSFISPSRAGTSRAFSTMSARRSAPEDASEPEAELDMFRFQRELSQVPVQQGGARRDQAVRRVAGAGSGARGANSTRPKYVAEEERRRRRTSPTPPPPDPTARRRVFCPVGGRAREPPPAETTQAAEPAKPFQLIDTEAVADKLQFKNPFPRIFKGPPPALQDLTQKYAEWDQSRLPRRRPRQRAPRKNRSPTLERGARFYGAFLLARPKCSALRCNQ